MTDTPPKTEEEQREDRRSRTFLGGKILLNQDGSVIDCLVRNKSDKGCQVIVESQHGIPDSFELKIGTTGERLQCTVAWRRHDKIGLEFKK
ncbi:MAG: PilZ domain-containing protein [Methyloligellaceae bacterium]